MSTDDNDSPRVIPFKMRKGATGAYEARRSGRLSGMLGRHRTLWEVYRLTDEGGEVRLFSMLGPEGDDARVVQLAKGRIISVLAHPHYRAGVIALLAEAAALLTADAANADDEDEAATADEDEDEALAA